MDFARLPICVFSFNRLGYLRRTLHGLREAVTAAGMAGPVVLFQDGAWNPHSRERKARDEDIAAGIAAFREAFPAGVVFAAPENLGIGLNIDRGERWAFAEQGYPAGLFFEDDMVVAPHYFRAMAGLYALAQAEPRIGMFAAYGSDGRATREEQRARRGRIGPMHHNWAFGLTRGAWEARETLTGAYTTALAGCDYRDRPLDRIAAWQVRLGWPPLPATQDMAKSLALNTLGIARISSCAICARSIGEVGQHYTPAQFRKLGLDEVVLLDDVTADRDWAFDPPDATALEAILAADRASLLAHRLGPEPFMGSAPLVEAARVLRAIGAGRLLLPGGEVLTAASGLYDDRWCHPEAGFVFAAPLKLREVALEAIAAQHLPPGTTVAFTLNGVPAATEKVTPGARFTLRLPVPARLDGLEKTLAARCSVRADPFSVGFNEDRRPLGFLLVGLELTLADGGRRTVTGEEVVAGLLGR